jgi:hypothetical protein
MADRQASRGKDRAGWAERHQTSKAKRIFTRKLHMRFTGAGGRNFLGYAQRSAQTLESPTIRKQAKKLRRCMQAELARLRGKPKPKP